MTGVAAPQETVVLGSEPRVLVVARDDDLVGQLCDGLDAIGWRTMTARSLAAATAAIADLDLDAAIVDATHADLAISVARLRAAAQPRRLAIIAIGPGAEAASAFADIDLAITVAPHPAQAALRLEQLIRASVIDEEFLLRQKTFAEKDAPLPGPDPDRSPLRVLVAGAADRRFIAMSNALSEAGAEIIGAPTPYTAFDYLHESAFDAAVLWGAEDHVPALSIAAGMKRNTRLYHIPLLLYLRSQARIDLGEIFARGFADVAAADTPEPETARRVVALASMHRRHLAIRKALEAARGSGLTDPTTGLFTPNLFAAHLARVAEAAKARRRPLSVCVLRVAETDSLIHARAGGWLDRAMPQIGAMVSRLVRVEDTAARLAPEVFALALPATRGPAGRLAAERIAAVIGCTAFDAGKDRSPFVVEFNVGTAELGDGENPAALLERASADLALRRVA